MASPMAMATTAPILGNGPLPNRSSSAPPASPMARPNDEDTEEEHGESTECRPRVVLRGRERLTQLGSYTGLPRPGSTDSDEGHRTKRRPEAPPQHATDEQRDPGHPHGRNDPSGDGDPRGRHHGANEGGEDTRATRREAGGDGRDDQDPGTRQQRLRDSLDERADHPSSVATAAFNSSYAPSPMWSNRMRPSWSST